MGAGKYPFVRLLIPFIAGIATAHFLNEESTAIPIIVWFFPLILGILLYLTVWKGTNSFSQRWMSGIIIYLFLFSSGGLLTRWQYQKTLFRWPEQSQFYEALLLTTPEERPRSFLCEAQIMGYRSLHERCGKRYEVGKKILLYLPKDKQVRMLKRGTLLYIRSRIAEPRNNGNPEEFDYRSYLLRKGISGTGLAEEWHQSTVRIPLRSLISYAESIRRNLLQIYNQAGIQGESYSILSALTLGHKEDLSTETRQSFSHAGVSHLLALSGLHVGFVYLIFEFLLSFLFRGEKGQTLRQFLLIPMLWSFAFLSGLMPPVIRATILFTLVALARTRNQGIPSFNALAAAAFLILFFRPLLLFDLSFQLSFAAVAGILLWQPWLFKLIPVGHRATRYLWSLATLSLAAQLATLPLTTHYFASFPSYFLVTNVAVIGLVSVIIYTTFFLFVVSPLHTLLLWSGKIVQEEIHLLQVIIKQVEQLPGSTLTPLYIPWWEAWSIAFLIFSSMYFFIHQKQNHKAFFAILAGMFCLISSECIKAYQRLSCPPQVIFYSSYNCPAAHLILRRTHSYLWSDTTSHAFPLLARNLTPYWRKAGISSPVILHTKSYMLSNSALSTENEFIRFQGKTLCQIKDQRWKQMIANHPLHIDYLWISRGYYGKIEELQSSLSIKEVILDASLPRLYQKELEQECHTLRLPYTNLSDRGAYIIPL